MDKLSDKIKRYESDPDSDIMKFLPEIEALEQVKEELISMLVRFCNWHKTEFDKEKYCPFQCHGCDDCYECIHIEFCDYINHIEQIELKTWDQITKEQK